MICTITPDTNQRGCVLRPKISPQDISATGKVEMHRLSERRQSQHVTSENKVQQRGGCKNSDPSANLGILWKTSLPLLFNITPTAWAGLMQAVHQGNHKEKSSITFLPMIDVNPSDVTCISFSLKFVSKDGNEIVRGRHKRLEIWEIIFSSFFCILHIFIIS